MVFCGVDAMDCVDRWRFCRLVRLRDAGPSTARLRRFDQDDRGWVREGIPQGLKPGFVPELERPKAEALGYLQAKTRADAGP